MEKLSEVSDLRLRAYSDTYTQPPPPKKKVSSRLTLFDITREISNQNCNACRICLRTLVGVHTRTLNFEVILTTTVPKGIKPGVFVRVDNGAVIKLEVNCKFLKLQDNHKISCGYLVVFAVTPR